MKIKVKLYADLRQFAPPGTGLGEAFEVQLQEGTLEELLSLLDIPKERTRLVLVNGVHHTDSRNPFVTGDLVVLFPPIGGG